MHWASKQGGRLCRSLSCQRAEPKAKHSAARRVREGHIAEGYGKRTVKDQQRFYDIARGSAHECGAIVDAAKVLGLIDTPAFAQAKRLLHRIVSMLVKLCG